MKKLEKLSLKELENELAIIGSCELKLINGGGIYEDYFKGLGDAVEHAVNNLTNSVYQTADDASNAIGGFWDDHGDKIIGTTIAGISVTLEFIMTIFTKIPTTGPFVPDPNGSDQYCGSGSDSNTIYSIDLI